MAFAHSHDPVDRKASDSSRSADTAKIGKQHGNLRNARIADLVLLILLVAVIGGAVVGYRALKHAYAPEWETREIIYVIELPAVERHHAWKQYWETAVYASSDVDAAPIGKLIAIPRTVNTDDPALKDTHRKMYVTVSATAYYLPGKGYRVGDTTILAGAEGTFRVSGLSSKGMIISLYERAEYDSLQAETQIESVSGNQ